MELQKDVYEDTKKTLQSHDFNEPNFLLWAQKHASKGAAFTDSVRAAFLQNCMTGLQSDVILGFSKDNLGTNHPHQIFGIFSPYFSKN